MQLARQSFTGAHPVVAIESACLRFDAGEFRQSVVVGSRLAPTPWAPRRVEQIDAAVVEALLAHQTALILLGTGATLIFPPTEVLAVARRRGVGLEVMDNRSAARTYNVLLAEERDVLLACLIAGD
jgi:uncharacterized protein